MAKVIDIEVDAVFIEDNGSHLQINKDFFNFEPRVNDSIIVFRNQDGSIARVILGSAQPKTGGLTSQVALMVISIYSIVFGTLLMLGQNGLNFDVTSFIVAIFLVVAGTVMLIFKKHIVAFVLAIICFVIYSIGIISGFVLIFFPLFGFTLAFLMWAIVAVPFAFGIVYFVKRSKERIN